MSGTYTLEDCTPILDKGKAVLFEVPDLDEQVWIPKSAIHDDSDVWKEGQESGDLVVHEWLAIRRNWI